MSQEQSVQMEKTAKDFQKHLRGVFSSQELRKVGTGTTTRKSVTKTFWYAEEEPDGRLYVQPINSNYVPTGNKKYISKDELLTKFSPSSRRLLIVRIRPGTEEKRSVRNMSMTMRWLSM